MVKKFLKIAGVKNEQEFYKKYPSEAAFFKAHPEAKDLKKHKKGGEYQNSIPKAQDGDIGGFLRSVGNTNCVGATWKGILGDGASGSGGGSSSIKVLPEWDEISTSKGYFDKDKLKTFEKELAAKPQKWPFPMGAQSNEEYITPED